MVAIVLVLSIEFFELIGIVVIEITGSMPLATNRSHAIVETVKSPIVSLVVVIVIIDCALVPTDG